MKSWGHTADRRPGFAFADHDIQGIRSRSLRSLTPRLVHYKICHHEAQQQLEGTPSFVGHVVFRKRLGMTALRHWPCFELSKDILGEDQPLLEHGAGIIYFVPWFRVVRVCESSGDL